MVFGATLYELPLNKEGEVQVGAYFYPLTTRCPERAQRAKELGEALGLSNLEIPCELALAQIARPLFPGHDQPRTYCIQDDMGAWITEWDDCDPSAFDSQVKLAKAHGLSHFIFNAFRGLKRGKPVHELAEFTRMSERHMRHLGSVGFKYARLETLERPRAVLPIPIRGRTERMFTEPDRIFDITPETARFLVDSCLQDWLNPNYLNLGSRSFASSSSGEFRPYMPILMPVLPPQETLVGTMLAKRRTMRNFIDSLREYAASRYNVNPYIVGVTRQPSDPYYWDIIDVDAITQYLQLPITSSELPPDAEVPPIQTYEYLMEMREKEWEELAGGTGWGSVTKPFIPSVPMGWDASPRGKSVADYTVVRDFHPYIPLVAGEVDTHDVPKIDTLHRHAPLPVADFTVQRFARSLQKAIDLTKHHIPEGQRVLNIFAWNEVTEGAMLPPRLYPDGFLEKLHLRAVHDVVYRNQP